MITSCQNEYQVIINSDASEHVKLSADARKLIRSSMANATRLAYVSRLMKMSDWFIINVGNFNLPISPESYADYIAFLVDRNFSVSYIKQLNSAVSMLHRERQIDDPTKTIIVQRAIKGACRTLGLSVKKKDALTLEALEKVILSIDRNTLAGKRDATILLFCFFGAFRRSELVSLDFADVTETTSPSSGLPAYEIVLKRSKTDQLGVGSVKGIFTFSKKHLCPIEAYKEYTNELYRAGIHSGAIFRRIYKGGKHFGNRLSGYMIAKILQDRACAAGIYTLDLGAHSLRSGFVTTAIRQGLSERSIQNQTGHKTIQILRGYYQRVNSLEDNAAENLS